MKVVMAIFLMYFSTQAWATSIMPGPDAASDIVLGPVLQKVIPILQPQAGYALYSGTSPNGTDCSRIAIDPEQGTINGFQINSLQFFEDFGDGLSTYLLDSSITQSADGTETDAHLHFVHRVSEAGDSVFTLDITRQGGSLSIKFIDQDFEYTSFHYFQQGDVIPDPPAYEYAAAFECDNLVSAPSGN